MISSKIYYPVSCTVVFVPFARLLLTNQFLTFSSMDVVQSKRMCRKKERIFNQLARRYDVDENNYDWDTIAGSKDSWIEQLNEALNELVETAEEMIDDHRNAMGGGEVQAWQLTSSSTDAYFYLLSSCSSLVIKSIDIHHLQELHWKTLSSLQESS